MKSKENSQARKVKAKATNVKKPSKAKVTSIATKSSNITERLLVNKDGVITMIKKSSSDVIKKTPKTHEEKFEAKSTSSSDVIKKTPKTHEETFEAKSTSSSDVIKKTPKTHEETFEAKSTSSSDVIKKTPKIPQKKAPTKSSSKSTRRTSKFKIIAAIMGVVVVASLGLGLGLGLSNQDDSKTQSQVISNLDDLKARLENLSTDPIEYENEIVEGNWENIDDDFFTNVVKKPIIKIPTAFDAQYRITNNLEFDGYLVVAFQIRNHGDSDWKSINAYTVRVYGITSMKAKTYFDGQMKKILDRSSTSGELEIVTGDLEDVKNEYFPSNVYQKPTYLSSVKAHSVDGDAIKRDGYALINFEISTLEGKKYLIPIKFKVGKDTWDANEILENLNDDSIYKPNGFSSMDWTSLDDDFFLLIIEKPKPQLPNNIQIEYRIANEVTNRVNVDVSDLVVDFRYRRNDIVNDEWTTFSSQYQLGIFWDKDLFDTKSVLESLPKNDITPTTDIEAVPTWQLITDDFFNNILHVTPPSILSNIDVEYKIPNAITDDGPFITIFRFKKKGHTDWQTTFHSVNVVNLPLEKAKTYVRNFVLKDDAYYFDNLDGSLAMFKSQQKELTKNNIDLILKLNDGETYQEFSNVQIKLEITPDDAVDPPVLLTLKFMIFYKGTESARFFTEVNKP